MSPNRSCQICLYLRNKIKAHSRPCLLKTAQEPSMTLCVVASYPFSFSFFGRGSLLQFHKALHDLPFLQQNVGNMQQMVVFQKCKYMLVFGNNQGGQTNEFL